LKTVAVIIAAYNADKYILDCYGSVKNQIPLEGWSVDIRIGVDGCQKTADVLRRAGIPFYWSEKNVGAYITRNSLIYLSPADVYSYFDADDEMFDDYLARQLLLFDTKNIQACMTAKINCDEKLKPIQGARIEYGGAITFSNDILDALGGFYGVRCAADSDFMSRIKMAGYEIKEIAEPLYYRRRHSESLTKKADTAWRSPYRNKVWKMMTEKREQGIIKIKPTIIKLEEVRM
jgi:glycosyltransferase involved in cell wall biosynthesis